MIISSNSSKGSAVYKGNMTQDSSLLLNKNPQGIEIQVSYLSLLSFLRGWQSSLESWSGILQAVAYSSHNFMTKSYIQTSELLKAKAMALSSCFC